MCFLLPFGFNYRTLRLIHTLWMERKQRLAKIGVEAVQIDEFIDHVDKHLKPPK